MGLGKLIKGVIIGAAIATGVGLALGAAGISGGIAMSQAGAFFLRQLVVQGVLGLAASALAPKPTTAAELRGQAIQRRDPIASRKIVYGKVKTSGAVVFLETTGDSNKVLHQCVTLAGHEISAVDSVYFNDVEVATSLANETQVAADSGTTPDFSTVANITPHFGAADQTADADLVADTSMTTDHRLRGIAYIYTQLTYSSTIYRDGMPNVSAVVQGKPIYDMREAGHSASDSSTWEYSNNPALCILDYLRDGTYGLGCDDSEIDFDSFEQAADDCDDPVLLSGGSTSEPRYTLNGVIDTARAPKDILDEMVRSCAGSLFYSDGQWKIQAGVYVTPTDTLTADDFVGEITVNTRVSNQSNFNAVKGIFLSPDDNWQPVDYPAITSSTFETEDNGERRYIDLTLPYTTSHSMAQRIAKIALYRNREQIHVTVPCKLDAFKYQVGDTIMLDYDRYGWDGKAFEILSWNMSVSDGSPVVILDMKETSSGVYDWNTEEAALTRNNTTLPSPWDVSAPTNLGTTHSASVLDDGAVKVDIAITWDDPNDGFVTAYEVEWKLSSDTQYQSATVKTNTLEIPVAYTAQYDVRVKSVNGFGYESDWVTTTVTPSADITAPSTPSSLTATGIVEGVKLAWTNPSDNDFDLVQIWRNTTNNSGTATRISDIRAESFVDSGLSVNTTYYYWLKSVDRTGNVSNFSTGANATTTYVAEASIDPTYLGSVDTAAESAAAAEAAQDAAETARDAANTLLDLMVHQNLVPNSTTADDSLLAGMDTTWETSTSQSKFNSRSWMFGAADQFATIYESGADSNFPIDVVVGRKYTWGIWAYQNTGASKDINFSFAQAGGWGGGNKTLPNATWTWLTDTGTMPSGVTSLQFDMRSNDNDFIDSLWIDGVTILEGEVDLDNAIASNMVVDSVDSATDSASAAATSASSASTSANNASISATAAAGSATSASTSASNASSSETNAATSETNALGSESAAASSATTAANAQKRVTLVDGGVFNAGFEVGENSLIGVPAGWIGDSDHSNAYTSYLGYRASVDSGSDYASELSFGTAQTNAGDWWSLEKHFLAEPSQTFAVSAKVYCVTLSGTSTDSNFVDEDDWMMVARWYDSDGALLSSSATVSFSVRYRIDNSSNPSSGTWYQWDSENLTAPTNTAYVKLELAAVDVSGTVSDRTAYKTAGDFLGGNAACLIDDVVFSSTNGDVLEIQQSAVDSAASAKAAATSETNAAASEGAASSSASAASTSATNASTSASQASTSATNAATSETNAAASESAASSSASAASTSATNASTSAGEASTSATSASTSATDASTAAINSIRTKTRQQRLNQGAGMLAPQICMDGATYRLSAYEDDTVIYKNGVELVTLDRGDLSNQALLSGDRLTSTKPFYGLIHDEDPYTVALGSEAMADTRFASICNRYGPYLVSIYPLADGTAHYTFGTSHVGTTPVTGGTDITLTQGTMTELSLSYTSGTFYFNISSDVPILVYAQGTGGDGSLLMPPSETILYREASTNMWVDDGSASSEYDGNVQSSTDGIRRLARYGTADGSGGDAEGHIGIDALGDEYVIPCTSIQNHWMCSPEDCTVVIRNKNGVVEDTVSVGSNPAQTGTTSGSGSALYGSEGPYYFSGTKPFALLVQVDAHADEEMMYGFRRDLKPRYGVEAVTEILQTSVTDLEGNAAASIVMRAKAGTGGAELELVAGDDVGGGSVSTARIDADNIILDGTVTADHITANSITLDLLNDIEYTSGLNDSLGIGEGALASATTGTNNYALGYNAGNSLTTGFGNIVLGNSALESATTSWDNIAIGNKALQYNYQGTQSLAIGSESFRRYTPDITYGNQTYNTAIGYTCAENVLYGRYSTYVGSQAGQYAIGGDYNTYIGASAGLGCATGEKNTIIGSRSLSSTTGTANTKQTTLVGYNTSLSDTNGTTTSLFYSEPVAGGSTPATKEFTICNYTGSPRINYSSDIPFQSLILSGGTGGSYNRIRINKTQYSGSTGTGTTPVSTSNFTVGDYLFYKQGGDFEIRFKISNVSDQSTYVEIAYTYSQITADPSGSTLTSNPQSGDARPEWGTISGRVEAYQITGLGSDITCGAYYNSTAIGYSASITGNNQVVLGNYSTTDLRCNDTSISGLSDQRDKVDFAELSVGLDTVNAITPYKYRKNNRGFYWDRVATGVDDDGNPVYEWKFDQEGYENATKKTELYEYGFKAQDFAAISNFDDQEIVQAGINAQGDEELRFRLGETPVILWKAVQELSQKNDELLARIEALEAELNG